MVVLVEDNEVAGYGQKVSLTAQDFATNGMECTQPDAVSLLTQDFIDAVAHLSGGFIGEGDGKNVPGRHVHHTNQISDAIGEHTGLA